MKKFVTIFLLVFVAQHLMAADFYWVGGSAGGWGVAANWSATSGGAGGAGIPAANDNVYIEMASDIKIDMSSMTTFTGVNGFNLFKVTKTGAGTLYTLDFNYNSTTNKLFQTNAGATGGIQIAAGCRLVTTGTTFNIDGSYSDGRLEISMISGTNTFDGGIHFMGANSRIIVAASTNTTFNDTLALYGGTGGAANFSLVGTGSTSTFGANAVAYIGRNGSSLTTTAVCSPTTKIVLAGNRKPDKTAIPTTSFSMLTLYPNGTTGKPSYIFDIPGVTISATVFGSSTVTMTNLDLISFGTGAFRFSSSTGSAAVITVEGTANIGAGVNAALFNTTSGTASVDFRGDLNINGTLSIQTNSAPTTLNAYKNVTINPVTGLLTSNGVGSVFRTPGTGAQVLNMPNFNAANVNMSFQNASNLVLASHIDTVRTVSAINGKLKLGNFNLAISSVGSITGSSFNYIVTDGTGKVIMVNLLAGSAKSIRIGSSTTSYDPVLVTPTNTTTFSFSVKGSFSAPVPYLPLVAQREWDITATGAGSTYMELTDGSNTGLGGTPVIGHFANSAWNTTDVTGVTKAADLYSGTNAAGAFSPFAVGSLCGFVTYPNPTIGALQPYYCKTVTPVTLTATPAGGTFTIDGNTATRIDPSVLNAGNHSVVYTYNYGAECTAVTSAEFESGPKGEAITNTSLASVIRNICPTCIDACNYLLPAAQNIQRLEIGERNLTSLAGIENFTNLRELYAENNKLTELPANLPANLRILYVNGNQLTSLPSTLPNDIRFLNVQGNKLTTLPASLPSNLLHLYVYSNQLTSLPEALPAGLSELHCFDNQLRRLPANLPNGLRLLYTEKNPMTCLPAKLPALAILRIDRNRIACIPHAINMVLDANFESIDLPICSTPCTPSLNRIKVSAFAGQSNNIGNELSWQVQNATSNVHFEVQYSQNGQDFETIGTLTADDKNTVYQFTDKAPQSKLSFYRLKINELGASEATFSAIIKIQSAKILRGVTIYPNPVSDVLMIENEAGQAVEIVNTLGQVVVKTKTTDVQTPINVANLQTGVYFVRIGDKQFKVLKQ